ncbi:hypothetical protein [Lactobacillus crispatus]|uniref:hypothetical protein n=1 Tax=Lactobacillus crispatus TaxID=47770 RepID=UPI00280458BF|nr:hypothetical protein [uncultured Lactobacillus sp.]
MNSLNVFDVATTVAVFIVMIAMIISLIEKVYKEKKPLTMEDIADLANMIVAQHDSLKGSGKEKKTEATEDLRTALDGKKGEVAKTVAENPNVAAGFIENAVNERHTEDK